MKTINARQLRESMEKTFDTVLSGEDVVITHRFKEPVRITRVTSDDHDKSKLMGLAIFDNATKKKIPFSKNVSLKKLYKESLDKKYGKK
jgi:antitoxin (DNA-binding transcriptional repressor) of toxin-antitoxin stability system